MQIIRVILNCCNKLRYRMVAMIILFILSTAACQFAIAQHSSEYKVKAVFIFNFTQFVEWPETAFAQKDSPFIIGLLGGDPFGIYLEETVRGEEINGHPLIIEHYQKIEDVKSCHLLFINLTKSDQLKQALEKLKTRPTLTVSDANNFTKSGGMIRFFTENNKTRIRINLKAAEETDLTISSKLLKLAEIVSTDKN